MNWKKICRILGGLVLGAMVGVFYAGCPSSGGTSKEYTLESSDSTYSMSLEGESKLHVKSAGKELDSVVLLVFLSEDCSACGAYYEHLNHLQASEKNLSILAIFDSKIDRAKLKEFAQNNAINFTLLTNTSSSSLLQNLLAKKRDRANALLKSSQENIQESMQENAAQNGESEKSAGGNNQPDTQNSVQNSTMSKDAAQESQNLAPSVATDKSAGDSSAPDSNAPESAPAIQLPYFVLYDDEQEFYQDYEGIVPEEIFSSDIAQILQ